MRSQQRSSRDRHWSEAARRKRLDALEHTTSVELPELGRRLETAETLQGQVENYVGVVRVPVGIAGPLLVHGAHATGRFQIPLATTEGTLVLAVSQGARAISAAGGAKVYAEAPRTSRAPLFVFPCAADARTAAQWAQGHIADLRSCVGTTTTHGRLVELEPWFIGRRLVLQFHFDTADAAGQNMVTLATDAACQWLRAQAPFANVESFSIETNVSHDKKLTATLGGRHRGRHVTAEVMIPRDVVKRYLRTTPEALARVAREGVYASAISGVVGAQAQFANVLAALLLATGQDVATIVESGTGLTVIETTAGGDLYASITIPSLILGTVGGGTRLPSQRECLSVLGCTDDGSAARLAEIAGGAVLAGELALVASLATDTFAQAHATYGRPRNGGPQ